MSADFAEQIADCLRPRHGGIWSPILESAQSDGILSARVAA